MDFRPLFVMDFRPLAVHIVGSQLTHIAFFWCNEAGDPHHVEPCKAHGQCIVTICEIHADVGHTTYDEIDCVQCLLFGSDYQEKFDELSESVGGAGRREPVKA